MVVRKGSIRAHRKLDGIIAASSDSRKRGAKEQKVWVEQRGSWANFKLINEILNAEGRARLFNTLSWSVTSPSPS